ncbi:Hypothetical protein R9X50_00785800 [Acrodontium crateriforme]|uniref:Uncharacterized protein n=1 Tax=Acrodontium crateriforme TaxID=150365 RepID=A0AAQ3MDA3_9PEZI|nr:Hypothetical protein R9X50_00785800 [Acrodontium crateriforme]
MSNGASVITDAIASNPPAAVAVPHGKNQFAMEDGVATQDHNYAKRMSVEIEDMRMNSSATDRELYPLPTEEELATLRKVAGTIPMVAWLLCIIEFAERASYYGAKGPFNNFMQNPLPKGGNGAGSPPRGSSENGGALGRGTKFASAIGMMFSLLAYVIPIFGAWIADTKLGRWKTIWIGVIVGGVAHVIMIGGAAPSVLKTSAAVVPFVLSLIILALGAGLFKPNVVPTLIDQYQHQQPYTKVLKSGEKVIVDPEVTISRLMLFFYGFVNIGGLYAVATVYSENRVGFWFAFLTPGIIYFALPFLLWFLNTRIVKSRPDGSVLGKFVKINMAAIKQTKWAFWRADFWDTVKPSYTGQSHGWTDQDVNDVKRTVGACAIFLYLPIYNVNDNTLGSASTTLPGAMTNNGVPNDVYNNFNSLSIIVFVPILSYLIYPALQKMGIKFGRINRITFGFFLALAANAYGAIIQWQVYQTSPCGNKATTCEQPSPLNALLTIPIYILTGFSECFVNVTCYELAYARSAPGMRSVVMSVFLFMNSLSYALGEIATPICADPYWVWAFAGPAIVLAVQTVIFWFRYNKFNHDEFIIGFDEAENNDKLDNMSETNVAVHEKHERHEKH